MGGWGSGEEKGIGVWVRLDNSSGKRGDSMGQTGIYFELIYATGTYCDFSLCSSFSCHTLAHLGRQRIHWCNKRSANNLGDL